MVAGVGRSASPIGVRTIYARAWDARVDVEAIDQAEPYRTPGAPVGLSPQNAWLLLGDEASFPSPSTLRSDAARGALGERYSAVRVVEPREDVLDPIVEPPVWHPLAGIVDPEPVVLDVGLGRGDPVGVIPLESEGSRCR